MRIIRGAPEDCHQQHSTPRRFLSVNSKKRRHTEDVLRVFLDLRQNVREVTVDADGAVLLSGLASISPSADGVFSARRGFEEGWMDASGTWLWSRSVWQDARDEGNSPYFY